MFDIPPPFQLHHLLCSLSSLPNDRTTPSLPLPGPTWSQPPLPPISKLSHSMQNQHSRLLGVPRHANNSPFWYSPSPQNTSGPDKLPLPSISLAPRQSGIVGLLWNQKIVKTGRAIIATANVGFKIPKLPNLMPLSSSTVVKQRNASSRQGIVSASNPSCIHVWDQSFLSHQKPKPSNPSAGSLVGMFTPSPTPGGCLMIGLFSEELRRCCLATILTLFKGKECSRSNTGMPSTRTRSVTGS